MLMLIPNTVLNELACHFGATPVAAAMAVAFMIVVAVAMVVAVINLGGGGDETVPALITVYRPGDCGCTQTGSWSFLPAEMYYKMYRSFCTQRSSQCDAQVSIVCDHWAAASPAVSLSRQLGWASIWAVRRAVCDRNN